MYGFTDSTQTRAATCLGALEGNLVTVTVTVTPLVERGAIAEAITVKYKTADALGAPPKAIAGEDYTATSGTLVFEAGAMGEALSKTFSVATTHDTTVEPDESFWAGLTSAIGAKIVSGGAKAGDDHDEPPAPPGDDRRVLLPPGVYYAQALYHEGFLSSFWPELFTPSGGMPHPRSDRIERRKRREPRELCRSNVVRLEIPKFATRFEAKSGDPTPRADGAARGEEHANRLGIVREISVGDLSGIG